MALLGTIRNRFGWVMMALVFIGVASFLFMDISPGSSMPSGNNQAVGYVNGDKVSSGLVQEYTQQFQGGQFLQEQIQERVWDQIISEKLVEQKTAEAGMVITPTEMGDLFLSNDLALLSPLVRQTLGDPSRGGAVNTEQVKQMITTYQNTNALLQQANGDAQQKEQLLEQQKNWLNLEQQVKKAALRSKYFNAVSKGAYTPNWMVELEHKNDNAVYDFEYVQIPYTNITDEITISDDELEAYIRKHPRQYKRDAMASVEYITFDVIATAQDSADYYNDMKELADAFAKKETSKEDSTFMQLNGEPIEATYYTKDELAESKEMIDSIFDADNKTVFGPYLLNGKYKILKKIDEKDLPDSVRVRQIVINATDQASAQAGIALLDSLKNLLETDPNADFDSLAIANSQDGSRFNGGDLGFQAKGSGPFQLNPQLMDYAFYTGEKDSLKIIYSRTGIHLVQITAYKYETDKKGVRIAALTKDIIPSAKTTEDVQRNVIEFIADNRTGEEFKASAKGLGKSLTTANSLEEGAYNIAGIGTNSTAADIISWAHAPETEEGSTTNRPFALENTELNYTEKFIVPLLVSRSPAGLASIKDLQIRADVDRILRNEKKTQIVKEKLATLTSLDAIAGQYSVIKEEAKQVNYGSATIPNKGAEPKVLGLVAKTPVGQMSGAVGGNEGVYVVKTTNVQPAGAINNLPIARNNITRITGQLLAENVLFENMKDNADIVDERNKY